METFHCSACQALIFFENTFCLTCGNVLAYLPDRLKMSALKPADDHGWQPLKGADIDVAHYKLCSNYTLNHVCNWALRADDPESLCESCRLTTIIPNLDLPASQETWAKLETAKRRLVYGLLNLKMPLQSKATDPARGLEFHFLSDSITANGDQSRVLTGHDNGLITINVAEADDVYRETQRAKHKEPYRTLLGHFRHEIGHYFWDRLIAESDSLDEFRRLFGDERTDYQEALKRHYTDGAPANWAENFISTYATSHPWEDWAESWAHVMHMIDALETSHSVGLSITPARKDEPALPLPKGSTRPSVGDFGHLAKEWLSLTYVLNNFSRGLGLADTYPFVLSEPVLEKLRFVCSTINRGPIDGTGS